MKTFFIIALIVLLGMGFLVFKGRQTSPINLKNQPTGQMQYAFEDPKKSAHFESSTPAHGSIWAGVPVNVVVDVNFDLAKPSEIKILKDGGEYGVSETTIDDNKLAMRRKMDPDSPDGLYKVAYRACWPDSSCHDGYFQFAIDHKTSDNFVNQTGRKEVEIKMSNIMFNPQNIRVSKGTKITWVNDDNIVHYVNTDPHPGHSYYLLQNSKALNKGENYSVTFDITGIYPYHCSAHADTMSANILVE